MFKMQKKVFPDVLGCHIGSRASMHGRNWQKFTDVKSLILKTAARLLKDREPELPSP